MTIEILYWIILLGVFTGLALLGRRTKLKLWARVVAALVIGAILGFIFGDVAASSKWIGDLFVRFIKMLVVPLIFTSLVAGVVSMGDPKRLGSIGIKTITLYLLTTLFAISIGLVLGTIFSPGDGIISQEWILTVQFSLHKVSVIDCLALFRSIQLLHWQMAMFCQLSFSPYS